MSRALCHLREEPCRLEAQHSPVDTPLLQDYLEASLIACACAAPIAPPSLSYPCSDRRNSFPKDAAMSAPTADAPKQAEAAQMAREIIREIDAGMRRMGVTTSAQYDAGIPVLTARLAPLLARIAELEAEIARQKTLAAIAAIGYRVADEKEADAPASAVEHRAEAERALRWIVADPEAWWKASLDIGTLRKALYAERLQELQQS